MGGEVTDNKQILGFGAESSGGGIINRMVESEAGPAYMGQGTDNAYRSGEIEGLPELAGGRGQDRPDVIAQMMLIQADLLPQMHPRGLYVFEESKVIDVSEVIQLRPVNAYLEC